MHSADTFARALCDLGRLRSLDINLSMPVIARAVGRLTWLENLQVRIQYTQDVEEFIRALDRLAQFGRLQCLMVSGNIDPTLLPPLAIAIGKLVNLQALKVHIHGADAIVTIAQHCFADLKALTHLDFGFNRMGRKEALAVAELAAQHLKALRTFELFGNDLKLDDVAAVTSAFGRDGIIVSR
jgi:hypothetical protein